MLINHDDGFRVVEAFPLDKEVVCQVIGSLEPEAVICAEILHGKSGVNLLSWLVWLRSWSTRELLDNEGIESLISRPLERSCARVLIFPFRLNVQGKPGAEDETDDLVISLFPPGFVWSTC